MPGPLLEDDDCACLLVKKPWKSLFVIVTYRFDIAERVKIDNFQNPVVYFFQSQMGLNEEGYGNIKYKTLRSGQPGDHPLPWCILDVGKNNM